MHAASERYAVDSAAPARVGILTTLPPQLVSGDVLLEKYAKGEEASVNDVRLRVAKSLAAIDHLDARRTERERQFLWAQEHGFIPAGRINSAVGVGIKATLMNCFVQPVGDSVTGVTDGLPGIYMALAEAAETMRRGGGVGYDFSAIRPNGSKVHGTCSRASGPVSYMEVFDASCKTVESAGARRGAQMGVLRVDHPDIELFVAAKDLGGFSNFNLSVGVTDAFMAAVQEDRYFDLVHKAEPGDEQIAAGARQREDGIWIYRQIRSGELWDKITASTYHHAEPGVLFIDRMNAENNLWYAEELRATNPCGEQPLPDYGCCDLGSLNLTLFVRAAFTPQAHFDFDTMREVAAIAVRMLDLVLDANEWPLPQQAQEAQAKRRIGLGFLGLGSALIMLGLRYNSHEGRQFAANVARELRDAAYAASIELAKEKGPFPRFDAKQYLDGQFIKRLPAHLREAIATHGIRNSHLLSIAPTGTISLAFADNASNGIEPVYAWIYERKKRMADGSTATYQVEDHAWRLYRHMGYDVSESARLPPQFVTALDLRAIDHLLMMREVQSFIDTAISKTVNVPKDYPYEDFRGLYTLAWSAGLKGLSTYRPNSVLGSVLSTVTSEPPTQYDDDPLSKRFNSRPLGSLESVTTKIEYWTQDGRKIVYATISFKRVDGMVGGRPLTIERPFEFFMPASQGSDGQQWISTAMRLLSMAARSGESVAKALADMRKVVWDKGPVRCGHVMRDGVAQAPVYHDSEVAAIGYMLQRTLIERGFLDAQGNQVPVQQLALNLAAHQQGQPLKISATTAAPGTPLGTLRKCPECNALSLVKVDGCERCVACQFVGACG